MKLVFVSEKEAEQLKEKPGVAVQDVYESQLREFFAIKNPQLLYRAEAFEKEFRAFARERAKGGGVSGQWVYYPWSNTLIRVLAEKELDEVRTNRNRDIITAQEQQTLGDFTVAVAGLSVGSNIASVLAYNGFSKNLKLADFDTLETSNLNRVRARLADTGSPKAQVIARQLYELDPYLNIRAFEEGLTEENLGDFVGGNPKTSLIFEIIDDLKLKILVRKEAQKRGVPVIMLTSIGDSVMVDVERYDTDKSTKPFNGLVDGKVLEDILSGKVPKDQVNKYVVQIVGPENIPSKVMESVKSIGKTLVGRPQLMSTVTVASGFAGFFARKIALGAPLPSGRTIVKFNDLVEK